MSVVASSFPLKNARSAFVSIRHAYVVIIPIITSEGGSRHENILGAALATGRPIPPSAPSASSATYPRDPSRSSRTLAHQRRHRARRAAGDDRAGPAPPSTSPTRTRRRARSAPWACARAPAGAGPPPGTRSVTCPRSPRRARARARARALDRRVWKRLAEKTHAGLAGATPHPPHVGNARVRTRAFERAPATAAFPSLVCFEFETFLRRFQPPSAACRDLSASSSAPRRRARPPRTLVAGWSHKRKKVCLPTSRTVRGTRRAASSRATRSSAWTFSRPRPRPDAARRCSGSRRSLRKPSL